MRFSCFHIVLTVLFCCAQKWRLSNTVDTISRHEKGNKLGGHGSITQPNNFYDCVN